MATRLTQDLRSEAKDHRRVKAQKSKWARGVRPAVGRTCFHDVGIPANGVCVEACNKRPIPGISRNLTNLHQRWAKKETAQDNQHTKRSFRNNVVEGVDDVHAEHSDSSGDFDIDDTSAAPELNEIMYSFDAPTGPSQGDDVLTHAITQAVQRFENNETEKMVKKEYDFVLDGKDEPDSYLDADDDFELIDHTHLN